MDHGRTRDKVLSARIPDIVSSGFVGGTHLRASANKSALPIIDTRLRPHYVVSRRAKSFAPRHVI